MKRIFPSILVLLSLTFSCICYAQSNYADSMQKVIATDKNDSVKALNALKLAFHYVFNDSAQARKYLEMAMEISKEKHIGYGEVNAYNVSGIFYDVQGMSDSALYYFNKGLEVNKKYGFADMDARLLNNLGMYSWNKGHLTNAQSYFFKAIEKNELVKDSLKRQDESTMLSNIGLIYQDQDLYEKALEYHHKALQMRRDKKQNRYIPLSLNNIGVCYMHVDQLDKAIETYKEGIALAKKIEDYRTLTDLQNNLATAYTKNGMHKEALALHLEVLNTHQKFKLADKIIMNTEAKAAGNYLQLRNYSAAWQHMNKALKTLEEQPELKHFASSVYSVASALYYHDNQPDKGLQYSLLGEELYEENMEEESLRKTSELEVQYETKKKEATIAAQQLRIAEDKKTIAQRNQWLVIVSALALLALGSFYLIVSRRKIKAEKAEEQKIHSTIFESEQKERIRIARDLHDSIGQKLSVIKMQLSQYHQNEELNKVAQYVDETVTEVRSISHNLIPEVLNFGLQNAIEEIADRINSTESIHVDFKANKETAQQQLPIQTELSIYRIVQEILTNIINHAKAKRIGIEMNSLPQGLLLNIEDNGKGFNAQTIDDSVGLGWKNIFARVKLINGELKVHSDKTFGSRFSIKIPTA